jgi:hypothetical protein
MIEPTPAAPLAAINQQLGAGLVLAGRFGGGEQGAYRVIDPTGGELALKLGRGVAHFQRLRIAAATTAHLCGLGYPAPTYRAIGQVLGSNYSLQHVLPGFPAGRFAAAQLPALIELIDMQASQAVAEPRDWPAPVVDTVLHGGEGFCVLETMRAYSPATRELLGVVQRLAADNADTPCETGDVVHIDFTPANVLLEGGQISGVIDWEGTHSGDRVFDLVTLLFYSYDDPAMREALWREALLRARPGMLRVYMAHLILRQVEWSARHHDRSTVAMWLERAAQVLRELLRQGFRQNVRNI